MLPRWLRRTSSPITNIGTPTESMVAVKKFFFTWRFRSLAITGSSVGPFDAAVPASVVITTIAVVFAILFIVLVITFVSPTELTITLSASDQATAGNYAVVVTNPTPGGGKSTAVDFTVDNYVPTLSSLSPTSATEGAAAQSLTLTGTNFVSNSSVTFNGVAHTTTFVSATELKITLSTSDQAAAGIYAVVVSNPAPGGGASNAVNFTVNNPVPTISSLSPASAMEGAAAETLTIAGTNFVSTSTVTFNAVPHTTTYVSAAELKIALSTTDLGTAGTYPVVVTNPTPGGGASNSKNFTVNP